MSKDVGDAWTPQLTVKDAAGELTAATVVLSVVAPDGTSSTPTVTSPSTGVYRSTLVVDAAGRWTAYWSVSGAVTGTEDTSIYVRQPGSGSIGLADAKRHLNIDEDDDTDDEEIDFFVAVANEWIATQVTDTTPAPVRNATLELVRHLWDSQRGPAALDLDADGFSLGLLGFAIPTRVKELLGPYLTGTAPPAATGSFPDAADWPDPVCW